MRDNRLDDEVNLLLDKVGEIEQEEEEIVELQNSINSKKGGLGKEIAQKKEAMLNGLELSEPVFDYLFFHWGEKARKNSEGVRKFVGQIEKFRGQLILEKHVGYSWTSSCISNPSGRQEGYILLGRLNVEKPYEIQMPRRGLVAVTGGLHLFRESSGWDEINRGPKLALDEYVSAFLPQESYEPTPQQRQIFERLNNISILRSNRPIRTKFETEFGFKIDVSSPLLPERTFGGTTKYDSEPHLSLIVGDEIVKECLAKYDFTVEKRTTEKAKIPSV